jgi:hypothetical protein
MPKLQLQHDLTLIFLTVNLVPKKWADFHKSILLEACGGAEIITVSKEPIWGNNIIQDGEPSASNIYQQMLRAAKLAKTEYVAIAEDDTLYTKEHFEFRPKVFGYNMSRWGLLSWSKKPSYFYRHRESNSALIANRKTLIECLEEYPEGAFGEVGKEKTIRQYGLKKYKVERFHSRAPIVNFHHKHAIDKMEQKQKKSEDKSLIANSIPCWGEAKELIKYFR